MNTADRRYSALFTSAFLVTLALVMSGCAAQPSTETASSEIRRYLRHEAEGMAALERFQMLGRAPTSTAEIYEMRFAAEVVFIKDPPLIPRERESNPLLLLVQRRHHSGDISWLPIDPVLALHVAIGTHAIIVGSIRFTKQNGRWIPTPPELSFMEPAAQ